MERRKGLGCWGQLQPVTDHGCAGQSLQQEWAWCGKRVVSCQPGHSTRGAVRTEGEAGGTGQVMGRMGPAQHGTAAVVENGTAMPCPDLGVKCKRLSLVHEWSVGAGTQVGTPWALRGHQPVLKQAEAGPGNGGGDLLLG